jgi:hypothetical protein
VTSSRTRCRCGSVLPEASSAAWCPVCFTAIEQAPAAPAAPPSAAPAPTFGAAPSLLGAAPPSSFDTLPEAVRRPQSPASLPASSIRSVGPWRDRWKSTDLTFGVTGRMVATLVWTVPFVFFSFAGLPFGLVGAIAFTPIWVRGIRDLWRRADRMNAARSHRRGTSSPGS